MNIYCVIVTNIAAIGCIQRIQQLSERLVIVVCEWNKLLDPR